MGIRGPVAVFAVTASVLGATAQATAAGGAVVVDPAGHYLVVLDDDAGLRTAVTDVDREDGVEVEHVYHSSVNGFAAVMTRSQARSLAADPAVLSVRPDVRVKVTVQPLPTGVNRANADASPTAAINHRDRRLPVDVAVIDTGVDLNHPDLRIMRSGAVNCSTAVGADDQNGHGTHVAGTIGALDNRIGVVGVAPGARIWPVRVLGPGGSGRMSDVICGVDYVTRHAAQIEVANLSLGGAGLDDGACGNRIGDMLHRAICASVAAGVTYVVAAGNERLDASGSTPAAYDEVITVSAVADFNGRPGGGARSTCRPDVDDTMADFSNFGRDVDLIAPGVCIRSTWMGGGYKTLSGTSMACPHVAGGAALYLARHPRATPARVRAALVAAGNMGWNAAQDPDGVKEPLLDVSGF